MTGADLNIATEQRRVKVLLKDMIGKGELHTEQRRDANRKEREFVVVGKLTEVLCDSPAW